MSAADSPLSQPDFDIRTLDLAQYFAPFGRRPMPDRAIWLLSLASSVLPENSVGAEVWIARVSGTCIHDGMLRSWAQGLASTLGTVSPKLGKRHRKLFAVYSDTWGHVAAEDGIWLAVDGKQPSVRDRARQLECDRDAYSRMTKLIAGFALMQAEQYEDALRWAVRACRVGEIDLDHSLTAATPAAA